MAETSYQRIARQQRERQALRAKRNAILGGYPNKVRRKADKRESRNRIADRIDGYDRDDLGESPDF